MACLRKRYQHVGGGLNHRQTNCLNQLCANVGMVDDLDRAWWFDCLLLIIYSVGFSR